MKQIIFTISLFLIGIIGVCAKSIEVEFSECVDGDTAKFNYKDDKITARFLAIDTPETVHPVKKEQPYGKEASEYTCNKLKNAEEIVLEYDEDSDKTDKYGRHLVWVFVDDILLQKKLVSKGYASVAYLYGDYKYTKELELLQQEAEDNRLGIWSIDQKQSKDEENEPIIKDYKEIIMLIGILFIVCSFSAKSRKKVKRKLIKEIKKNVISK